MTDTENRLDLIAPDLSVRILGETAPKMREIALLASQFALEKTGLSHPIIQEALAALNSGTFEDLSLRERLSGFVEQLDLNQWDLKELVDEGNADVAEYVLAFSRARAANALYFAFDPNEYEAATESIYEANAATNELTALRKMILSILEAKDA